MKELCVREHWETGAIYFPQENSATDEQGNSAKASQFEQARGVLIQSLLLPVVDAVDEYDTLSPTDEQILCFKEQLYFARNTRP